MSALLGLNGLSGNTCDGSLSAFPNTTFGNQAAYLLGDNGYPRPLKLWDFQTLKQRGRACRTAERTGSRNDGSTVRTFKDRQSRCLQQRRPCQIRGLLHFRPDSEANNPSIFLSAIGDRHTECEHRGMRQGCCSDRCRTMR